MDPRAPFCHSSFPFVNPSKTWPLFSPSFPPFFHQTLLVRARPIKGRPYYRVPFPPGIPFSLPRPLFNERGLMQFPRRHLPFPPARVVSLLPKWSPTPPLFCQSPFKLFFHSPQPLSLCRVLYRVTNQYSCSICPSPRPIRCSSLLHYQPHPRFFLLPQPTWNDLSRYLAVFLLLPRVYPFLLSPPPSLTQIAPIRLTLFCLFPHSLGDWGLG